MWIRSQNGEELINSSRITIESDFNNCYYNENYKKISGKHWFIRADIVVGAYSTKEKAMKVMDMIHDQIKSEFVFQMPEDTEI